MTTPRIPLSTPEEIQQARERLKQIAERYRYPFADELLAIASAALDALDEREKQCVEHVIVIATLQNGVRDLRRALDESQREIERLRERTKEIQREASARSAKWESEAATWKAIYDQARAWLAPHCKQEGIAGFSVFMNAAVGGLLAERDKLKAALDEQARPSLSAEDFRAINGVSYCVKAHGDATEKECMARLIALVRRLASRP